MLLETQKQISEQLMIYALSLAGEVSDTTALINTRLKAEIKKVNNGGLLS